MRWREPPEPEEEDGAGASRGEARGLLPVGLGFKVGAFGFGLPVVGTLVTSGYRRRGLGGVTRRRVPPAVGGGG